MRRHALLLCIALFAPKSVANAQCTNCQAQAEQPAYYFAPTQQPMYYAAPQQPTYYSVDSWSVCDPISHEPMVGYCKTGATTYPIYKPVRSYDEFGNETIKWVREERTQTYTTATPGRSDTPPLIQVAYKGQPLVLTNPAEQGGDERLLIAARKAVINTADLRLGVRSCINEGGVLDVEFVRVSDDTTGHMEIQAVDGTLQITVWLRPQFADPNQPTPVAQPSPKDEAKQVFLAVREQLATLLGVAVPPGE